MHTSSPNRRLLSVLVAVVAVAAVALLLAPNARAGRYTVAQCDRSNRAYPDALFERRFSGDYAFAFRCEEDEDANSLQIHALSGAPDDRWGRISWAAPTGTRIVAVSAEARLRSDSGHQARLSFLDGSGNEVGRIATGGDSPGGFETYSRSLSDAGRERFAASLACVQRDGCRYSEQARTWLRSVRLTIEDKVPPAVAWSGSILGGGWKRGKVSFQGGAGDTGSGVAGLYAEVNGVPVPPSQTSACASIAGTGYVSRVQPCPLLAAGGGDLDTAASPFVNGENRLTLCAIDYGSGPATGCAATTVHVDNAQPEVAFSSAQDPEDPEVISAPVVDRHSGAAGGLISYRPLDGGAWRDLPTELVDGRLQARVDSSAEPPGRYIFRAAAGDNAGNLAASTARADGSPMVLSFPLRTPTDLAASVGGDSTARLRYGERPRLEATLRDADGRPLAGQPLDVVEAYAHGSSLAPVGRTVTTDSRGRIDVQLPAGPSREISIAYAGSRRYLAAAQRKVGVTVEGYARLAAIPRHVTAGRKVLFRGSVGTLGAVLGRGKLVELQVKGGGIRRFRTIRQAFRTDPRGRWSLRYGFDRFYKRPTRFRFRLKVSREGGWPYLAPSVSRSRTLQVVPRKKKRRGR
ncbi:MAG: hypothetical protein M9964_06165 [Solirubrobacterales bacterium]|nr:hypothetical protein [Solirubrobacterales bacterium]